MRLLLVLLLQSTALLSLGFSALHLTRRRGPAVQTLIGRATLSGVALLLLLAPLSGRVCAVWRVPTPVRSSPPLPKREGEEVKTDLGAPLSVPPVQAAPFARPAPSPVSTASTAEPAHQEGAASNAPTLSLPAPLNPSFPNPSFRKDPAPEERGSKAVGLPSLLLLFWLALCQWRLIRLRRTAHPVADGPAAALLATLTPSQPVLLTHPAVTSPFLAGVRRPAIFLPPTYAADFDADALRAIFTHELAHRDRRDNLWTLAARLLTALLWFQPLLWLLARKLEQFSEDACDEAVLASDFPPRAYAACLLSLAERPPLTRSQRTLTAGVAPFRSSVGHRIRRILTAKGVRPMTPLTFRLRLTAAALTVAAALGGVFLVSSAPAQTTAAAPFVPTPQELRHEAERKQDLQNLKDIGQAINRYIPKHHYRLPGADHWADQIGPYLQHKDSLFDPFQPGQKRYGYGYNRNCSGKSLFVTASPSETVIVFDSTLGTRNANDTGQSLRVNPPGSSRINVTGSAYGFVDGHAKWLRQEVHPSFSLKGGPPTTSNVDVPKVKPDEMTIYATGNVRIQGVLNNNQSAASTALADRSLELRRITQELEKHLGKRSVADNSNGPLSEAQFLAGLTAVQGPGVIVTLTDSKETFPRRLPARMLPPNTIHDTDINQVVNELKSAGAEAISINGQRLVVTSAVRTAGTQVFINGVAGNAPYTLKAIGNSAALLSALNLQGGIASQIRNFDPAMFSAQEASTLTLPAYTGDGSRPRYARPVGASEPDESLNTVGAALPQQLSQLQAENDETSARIATLNAQLNARQQAFVQERKHSRMSPQPPMTAGELRNAVQSLNNKLGKGKHSSMLMLAALNQYLATAHLPPTDPARIAARERFAPMMAKLQFVRDVARYTQQAVDLYNSEADAENNTKRQIAEQRRRQNLLRLQLDLLHTRIMLMQGNHTPSHH